MPNCCRTANYCSTAVFSLQLVNVSLCVCVVTFLINIHSFTSVTVCGKEKGKCTMSSNYRFFSFASGILLLIIIIMINFMQVFRVEVGYGEFLCKSDFLLNFVCHFLIFQNKISLIVNWRLICSNIKCQFKNQWLLFASQQAIWRTSLCRCSILIGANCQKCSASFVLFFTTTVCRHTQRNHNWRVLPHQRVLAIMAAIAFFR